MTATIIRGDARLLPLPDASVDLVVTSPPYFALRSYTDGGEHYDGQIGAEPTPAEYIASLIECTREWMRVLKPGGSCFVNLGDKYSGSRMDGSSGNGSSGTLKTRKVDGVKQKVVEIGDEGQGRTAAAGGVPTKSLMMLPERYRIAAVDELGLIARAVIVWSKPNGLPESVTDRVRRSHEDWVHLTKQPRYFSAVDEIREGFADARPMAGMTWEQRKRRGDAMRQGEQSGTFGGNGMSGNPLGKLPGSVWEIATEPLKVPDHLGVDHFAAFPTEWPRRIILGWSPSGICTACGEGRRPDRIVDWDHVPHHIEHRRTLTAEQTAQWCDAFAQWCAASGVSRRDLDRICGTDGMGRHWTNPGRLGSQVPTPEQWERMKSELNPPADLNALVYATTPVRVADFAIAGGPVVGRHRANQSGRTGGHLITGEACACPDTSAPTRPAVVLDPFSGTGTTALVASVLGRHGIGVDRSADYCRLARWRTTDPAQRAKAARVPAPPKQFEGQQDLFGEWAS